MPGRSSTVTEIACVAIAVGNSISYHRRNRTGAGRPMRVHTALSALSLLPFVCTALACAVLAPGRRASALTTQIDDDWKYWMEQYPETATAFGYPGQDARWTDYSSTAIEARNVYLRDSATRLAAVDRASLDATGQLNFDLYRDLLETAV